MRHLIPAVFIALCVLPVMALIVNHQYFPNHIEQRLNQSAQSGDLHDVQTEASRLGKMYPDYQDKIASYVKNIATPAAKIMSAMKPASEGQLKGRYVSAKTDLASELNNIDTGGAVTLK